MNDRIHVAGSMMTPEQLLRTEVERADRLAAELALAREGLRKQAQALSALVWQQGGVASATMAELRHSYADVIESQDPRDGAVTWVVVGGLPRAPAPPLALVPRPEEKPS
jgi:hypothetical protein